MRVRAGKPVYLETKHALAAMVYLLPGLMVGCYSTEIEQVMNFRQRLCPDREVQRRCARRSDAQGGSCDQIASPRRRVLVFCVDKERWCARRDSNSRPNAPEDVSDEKSTTYKKNDD